jgi:molecular chaperone HscC
MIIGIDLGTLQSAAAVWTPAGVQLIPNALGETFTPSVVGVSEDGQLLVGRAASECGDLPGDRRAEAFKQELGSDRTWLLNQRPWTAPQLASLILRSLNEDAQVYLGQTVRRVVLAVPACFHPAQRQAICEAGRLAGLEVVRLINSSTATALAAVSQSSRESKVGVSVVWGTSFLDLAVVEFFPGAVEVRAVGGARAGAPPACEPGDAGAEDSPPSPAAGGTESSLLQVRLRQLEVLARRCLDDAGYRSQHVDRLILAGTGPGLPAAREWLQTRFSHALEGCLPPQELVARGAAVFAGHLAGGAGLQDLVVSEVAGHSLASEVLFSADAEPADCGYCPLISRGTPLPAGCRQRFQISRANQTEIHFRLYQSDQSEGADHRPIDEFVLQGIPAVSEPSEIEVCFAYDASELLQIEAALSIPQNGGPLTIRRPRAARESQPWTVVAEELQTLWNRRRIAASSWTKASGPA